MILTGHQPVYLPWLGLFHKIFMAEEFCLFDIAQYQKRDYNNRNQIKTQDGIQWLSVPVESKNHFEKKICDIKIVNNGWDRKHCKSIYFAYKKSKYLDLYFGSLEGIIIKKHKFLTDLNLELLKFFLNCLELETSIKKASDYNFEGSKSELVLDMCLKLGAKKYIFGSQGRNYANEKSFHENNIEVAFQEYKHPKYNQLYGEFVSNLSIIDLLFNEGPQSKNIFIKNNLLSI